MLIPTACEREAFQSIVYRTGWGDKRMNKKILAVILTIVLGLQGCATVPAEGEKQSNNKALWVLGGLVVAGAIAASNSDGSDENCYWVYRDNGQSRVCNP